MQGAGWQCQRVLVMCRDDRAGEWHAGGDGGGQPAPLLLRCQEEPQLQQQRHAVLEAWSVPPCSTRQGRRA